MMATIFAWRFGRFVTQKLRRLHRLCQAVDRAVREQHRPPCRRRFPCRVPPSPGGSPPNRTANCARPPIVLQQFRRKAVRRVQIGRLLAGDDRAAFVLHARRTSGRSDSSPRRSCAEEIPSSLLMTLRHAIDGSFQFGIRPAASSRPPFGTSLCRNGSRMPIWWPSSTARRSSRLMTYLSLFGPGYTFS